MPICGDQVDDSLCPPILAGFKRDCAGRFVGRYLIKRLASGTFRTAPLVRSQELVACRQINAVEYLPRYTLETFFPTNPKLCYSSPNEET